MPPKATDLRTIPLFRDFGDGELAELAARFEAATEAPLFEVGDPGVALYLLTAGEVVLEVPGDDTYRLRPPALIGELGALTGMPRTSTARPEPGAVVWRVAAKSLQALLADNQELGVRFLVNLLDLVADKVHRDQRRMGELRGTVIRTQKALKHLRELVLEAPETPLSRPVHDAVEALVSTNRRVNYRVQPPAALASRLRVDAGTFAVTELSRSHLTATWRGLPPKVGDWLAGVAELAGTEVPVSGKVHRVDGGKVTLELDLLIEEFAVALEGYLTRVQLLDVLV
ncbi:MAG: cyclic nucleotide-binding domain-containing protein [Kofleriaceae bacterium]